MNKTISLALAATVLTFAAPVASAFAQDTAPAAAAPVVPREGQVLYDAKGKRVVTINRVTSEGAVRIIFDGRLLTVPTETLSLVNGKLTTSLTKAELAKLR